MSNFLSPSINCLYGKLQIFESLVSNKVHSSLRFQPLLNLMPTPLLPQCGEDSPHPSFGCLSPPGVRQVGEEERDQYIFPRTATALPCFSGRDNMTISDPPWGALQKPTHTFVKSLFIHPV